MFPDTSDNLVQFFDSLKRFSDIRKLIHDGEAEGQYLECKSPRSPQELDRNLQAEISQEISGFSNAGGGIIIFGVSTDPKQGLDVLTQIEPIGLVKQFSKKLELNVPLLTEPPVKATIKVLKNRQADTKGAVLMYIPNTSGDPIKAKDHKFYLRTGDKTPEMPYETVKRMFLGSTSPDLDIVFNRDLIKQHDDKKWEIPIILQNKVGVPAKSISVSVEFNNPLSFQEVSISRFSDVSSINPNKKIFMADLSGTAHKGLNLIIGKIFALMKPRKRLMDITITVYAEYMRAKNFNFKINVFSKGKIQIKKVSEDFLY